ncbi:hypothetical protein BC939DRAFT_281807 [Gamsiella multidivaricata]|uniref:uncharacterized protein n=1 Tax=Gamsiella multidivaricata TaxID=101098 RepID=UPI0022207349|nr:uncharacterized protein BC939DRAFT_281807 [Gamsiella multidivaricata]KAI7830435.1 hypothetical protein BC939DRAFT_281807 [Gamsiella multidivaricata]
MDQHTFIRCLQQQIKKKKKSNIILLSQNIEFYHQKAKEMAKNKTLALTLERAIYAEEYYYASSEKSTGTLIYACTCPYAPELLGSCYQGFERLFCVLLSTVLQYNALNQITDQVSAAIRSVNGKDDIDQALLDKECSKRYAAAYVSGLLKRMEVSATFALMIRTPR